MSKSKQFSEGQILVEESWAPLTMTSPGVDWLYSGC